MTSLEIRAPEEAIKDYNMRKESVIFKIYIENSYISFDNV